VTTPSQSPTIARARLTAACVAAATVGGCATAYEPTEARWQEAAGLRAAVTEVEGPLREVRVSLETAGPQRIEAMRLAPARQPPCASTADLAVVDAASGQVLELPQELDGAAEVKLQIPRKESLIPALMLDVWAPVVIGPEHSPSPQARCLRLPLTALDRALWRARRPRWSMGASARWEIPVGVGPGGVGMGPTFEMRGLRPVGPVRALIGVTFGAAGCRRDCPPVDFATSSDGENTLVGIFGHMGLVLGLEHRLVLGRWGLELAAGGRGSFQVLQVPAGYPGDRLAVLLGPFAALRLTFPDTHPVTGFSPPIIGMLHGIELGVGRPWSAGRGPHGGGWIFSLGTSFEGTL
jgi:hypothetical protein